MNKYYYSNNSIDIRSDKENIAGGPVFFHLNMGKFPFSALEMFGKT